MLVEVKKLKRSFLGRCLLLTSCFAGILPWIQFAINKPVRGISPLQQLFGSSWLLIALLNTFLVIIAASYLYYLEFQHGALLHMETLPIRLTKFYLAKVGMMLGILLSIFFVEGLFLSLALYTLFPAQQLFSATLLLQLSKACLLTVPVATFMLLIAAICENIWGTIGVGLIGIFLAQLTAGRPIADYIPFALNNQLVTATAAHTIYLLGSAFIQSLFFIFLGMIWTNLRRYCK